MNVIISNKYQALLATLEIDVIKHINGEFEVTELINMFTNFFFNKMIIDVTALKNYNDINVIQQLSMNLDMSKVILLLGDSEEVNSPLYLSKLVSMGIYNFTRKPDVVKFLIDNPNSYKDVAHYQNLNEESMKKTTFNDGVAANPSNIGLRVLGIKNVTDHAGATTLTYMIKKHLEKHYKLKTIELDKNDFSYLNDNTVESISSDQMSAYINSNNGLEVIIVDLNNAPGTNCHDVIYLIEPGLIKLNKLIKNNSKIFENLKNYKIVLNRSILTNKDVSDFEKESGSKIFANIPNIDDKLDHNSSINTLLISLGFTRLSEKEQNGGLFGIF